jgi:lipoate-protein ligase A
MEWRLLLTGFNDAFTNMSIDESILIHRSKDEVPSTIRFYGWSPPAVSVGYFQSLKEEVNLKKCEELKIDYIRRITGGGAVFHEKEVTYSCITPIKDTLIPEDILGSYKKICGGIIQGLSRLGIESNFVPLNDIIANGKKISGNAQTRKFNTILQHGTILIDTDVEKMFSILKVPSEKLKDKMIKHVKDRVTGINPILNREVDFNKVCDVLAEGFGETIGIELVKGELTESEVELAQEIAKERYKNKGWNHKR